MQTLYWTAAGTYGFVQAEDAEDQLPLDVTLITKAEYDAALAAMTADLEALMAQMDAAGDAAAEASAQAEADRYAAKIAAAKELMKPPLKLSKQHAAAIADVKVSDL